MTEFKAGKMYVRKAIAPFNAMFICGYTKDGTRFLVNLGAYDFGYLTPAEDADSEFFDELRTDDCWDIGGENESA